ncbi:hypothetical protein CDD83_7694 [Cordyceps sp. RAO-2017]|nr:hypothetical protein CDD83_7694 [Cordyceps sp. RAO-2017]
MREPASGSRRGPLRVDSSWRLVEGEHDSFDTTMLPSSAPDDDDNDVLVPLSSGPPSQLSSQRTASFGASQDSIRDFAKHQDDEQVILREPFRPSMVAAAPAARAIHMTIKSASDGDGVTTETMADRLRFVQAEPWRKLRYTDENDEAAWDVYNESLFLRPDGLPDAGADPDDKAKAPDAARLDGLSVPRFAAKWRDKQMLQAVSGIVKSDLGPDPAEVKPEPARQAGRAR